MTALDVSSQVSNAAVSLKQTQNSSQVRYMACEASAPRHYTEAHWCPWQRGRQRLASRRVPCALLRPWRLPPLPSHPEWCALQCNKAY